VHPVYVDHARALTTIGPKTVPQLIKEGLSSKNTRVVANTATTLGWMNDRRAVKPLIKLLNHKDGDVVMAAVESLGILRDTTALPHLLPIGGKSLAQSNAPESSDERKRSAGRIYDAVKLAARQITKHGRRWKRLPREGTVAYHSARLADSFHPDQARPHTYALAREGSAKAVKALIELGLSKRELFTTTETARAMMGMGPEAVDSIVKYGLGHSDSSVVSSSAGILAAIGDKRALPHLMKLADHPNEDIRKTVKYAIRHIRGAKNA
jgi:HEAT repeat protein